MFPVNNLFKTVKEKVKGPVLVNNQLEIKDEELQSRTKKDRRKIRHEKFLKSELSVNNHTLFSNRFWD